MASGKAHIDRLFFGLTFFLVVFGLIMFGSASLGVLARNEAQFYAILLNQFLFAVIGLVFAYGIGRYFDISFLRRYAFFIFIGSLLLTLSVFIPGFGFEHGGARRWIDLGFTTFQPGEILKLGAVIYFAAWLSLYRQKIHIFSYGLVPLLLLLTLCGGVLIAQPDTDTFLIIAFATFGMYFASGCRWRDIGILAVLGTFALGLIAYIRPYILNRVHDWAAHFLGTGLGTDALGQSYQANQSLIAIGSGELVGKGIGQGIQKFGFLPESISDSIFSIIAEETGFIGAALLIIFFVLLALRGIRIANESNDSFGGLLAFGIVILLISQAFMNIAAMMRMWPLSGLPLTFISHGGTALLMSLVGVGIILAVSKKQ